MAQGNKNLKNPFYFIKDRIIFNISNENEDNDVCGKHYKTFDVVTKTLKKGDTYTDIHGNKVVATEDGSYSVSKGTDTETATISANKNVFPHFEVTYQYEEDGETKTGKTVYWLDEYIKDGDKVDGSGDNVKFANKTIHKESGEEEVMTYEKYFKTLLLDEIGKLVKAGYSKERIESKYGMFMAEDHTAIVNGKEVVVTDITSDVKIIEDDIIEAIKNVIKEFGDSLLEEYDKECEVEVVDKN